MKTPMENLAESMGRHTSEYVREFTNLCGLVSSIYDIELQDAKDIVQNAFFESCLATSPAFNFYVTWKGRAKWRALDFKHNIRNRGRQDITNVMDIMAQSIEMCEVDLTKLVNRKSEKKAIELYMMGMEALDVAKAMGLSQATARSYLSRGLDCIRKKLVNEL